MNEGKSRVRGSEEIPNANEESIRLLSGLWLMRKPQRNPSHLLKHEGN